MKCKECVCTGCSKIKICSANENDRDNYCTWCKGDKYISKCRGLEEKRVKYE